MPTTKTPGNINHITFDVTEPLQFKELNMDFKQMNIICGTNGTGKTFLLKINWIFATVMNTVAASREANQPVDAKLMLQYFIDKSFKDHNMTGTFDVEFDNDCKLVLDISGGSVFKAEVIIPKDVKSGGQPLFMSTAMRKFEDIVAYMKVKKMLGLDKGMPATEEGMEKLTELYFIFDIIAVERLFIVIDNLEESHYKLLTETLKKFDETFIIKDMTVDYKKPDITYCNEEGTDSSVVLLGAGHQSLLNMVLMQI